MTVTQTRSSLLVSWNVPQIPNGKILIMACFHWAHVEGNRGKSQGQHHEGALDSRVSRALADPLHGSLMAPERLSLMHEVWGRLGSVECQALRDDGHSLKFKNGGPNGPSIKTSDRHRPLRVPPA